MSPAAHPQGRRQQRLVSAFWLGLVLCVGTPAAAKAETATNPWTLCAKATNRVERQEGIPRQLLRAIAKAESGRYHKGRQVVMAWPWTVMAEGRGRYLDSKAAAIAEVKGLRARGVRNIDVGCMQINLMHHADAFPSLEDAFDPLTNVRYAAAFLKSLAAEQNSWAKAAAYYHSQTPARYRVYRKKIRQIWAEERERYLLALARFRDEQQSAMSVASLRRIDTPLPADYLLTAMSALAIRRALPADGAILARASATVPAPLAYHPEIADVPPPVSAMGFARAGPVRSLIDTQSM